MHSNKFLQLSKYNYKVNSRRIYEKCWFYIGVEIIWKDSGYNLHLQLVYLLDHCLINSSLKVYCNQILYQITWLYMELCQYFIFIQSTWKQFSNFKGRENLRMENPKISHFFPAKANIFLNICMYIYIGTYAGLTIWKHGPLRK